MTFHFSHQLFQGPRLKLSAPRPEDVVTVAQWTTDDAYLRLVDTDLALPLSAESIQAPPKGGFEFRLRRRDDDSLIGFVALFALEWGNRTAKMAIGIGESKFRGMGYGTEGMQLILQYAFREMNLHRVGLDIIAYNESAIRLYQKVGFQLEGRLREAVWREGHHYDRLEMGLLAPEWVEGI